MDFVMYDLAGAEPERRFSPYCWRTKLAFAHKGLRLRTIPWRFTEKAEIAFSGQGLVPVLRAGDQVLHDSWAIACWLEDHFPDRPSLFGGDAARQTTRFLNYWADAVLGPAILRMVALDIHAHLAPPDQEYFRTSREARFGQSLEALVAQRQDRVEAFRTLLQPARLLLRETPFLAGATPGYADHILFGSLMWPRSVSTLPLLATECAVHAWRERMLDAYDGLARSAPGYDAAA